MKNPRMEEKGMKIDSSAVTMSSNRKFYSHFEQQSEEAILLESKAATLDFSDESKSLVEQMKEGVAEINKEDKRQAAENERKNMAKFVLNQNNKNQQVDESNGTMAKTIEELRLETMRKILELLQSLRAGSRFSMNRKLQMNSRDIQAQLLKPLEQSADTPAIALSGSTGTPAISISNSITPTRMEWKKITATSAFYSEVENTSYSSQGTVKTADGREINFGINVEMSRAFCEKYESITKEDYVFTDPLVINLDTNVGSVSDQKFLFDLDADGAEEEISFAGEESGFLALDKNKDGEINDGNELFGTKSGDGFADLAVHDEDGNGWIDESDAVFSDLAIWTKDEDGNNKLLSLKEANVGAIYLGKASTQFSLQNDETHNTNGVVRNTGIYLKETGEVGTVQHIDLAI